MARLSQARRRTGFSLVELLVVVGIITVLAALVTAGVGRYKVAQQVKATETALTKIRLGFDQQWKATLDQVRDDGRKQPSPQSVPQEVWDWCLGDRDRTTALWGYVKLRLEFPQTFEEARNPVVLVDPANRVNPVIVQPKHTFAQVPDDAPTTLAQYRLQSAILLYLIMSERGGRGMTFSSDDVANGDVDYKDAKGNAYKFKVFKDSWGQPICFERFTTSPDANLKPYAKEFNPRDTVLTIDSLDPMYKLGDVVHWDVNLKTVAESAVVSGKPAGVMPPLPPGGATSYTPPNFYTFPTVVPGTYLGQNRMYALISFGPDKKMDANPLSGDDLYSYRLHRPGNTSN
jgi:prepilin-type N-terminal cleavage/methylation domain-containing protein